MYGLAISNDGQTIIALNGMEPQFITVYKKNGTGYAVNLKKRLSRETNSTWAASFSPKDDFAVFVNGSRGLYYDRGTNKIADIPTNLLPANPVDIMVKPLDEDMISILSDNSIAFFEKGNLVLRRVLPEATFIPESGRIVFSEAGFLYRYEVVKR